MHKDKLVKRLQKDLEKYAERLEGKEKVLHSGIAYWERRQTKEGAFKTGDSGPWDHAQDSLQEWIDEASTKLTSLLDDMYKLKRFREVIERNLPD